MILEIASAIASIAGLIIMLFFQWQGDKMSRNYIFAVTALLFVIFVLLRRQRKITSSGHGSSKTNLSRQNSGVLTQIDGDSNQVFLGASPAAPANDPDVATYHEMLLELRKSMADSWKIPLNDPDRRLFERFVAKGWVINLPGDLFIPKNRINPRVFKQ